MRRWHVTDSVQLGCVFYSWDTNLPAECDATPTISVWNAVGTLIVDGANMSASGNTGEYFYYLDIPAGSDTGVFNYKCTGVINSRTQILHGAVEVV
jgi:hypothetical protein